MYLVLGNPIRHKSTNNHILFIYCNIYLNCNTLLQSQLTRSLDEEDKQNSKCHLSKRISSSLLENCTMSTSPPFIPTNSDHDRIPGDLFNWRRSDVCFSTTMYTIWKRIVRFSKRNHMNNMLHSCTISCLTVSIGFHFTAEDLWSQLVLQQSTDGCTSGKYTDRYARIVFLRHQNIHSYDGKDNTLTVSSPDHTCSCETRKRV